MNHHTDVNAVRQRAQALAHLPGLSNEAETEVEAASGSGSNVKPQSRRREREMYRQVIDDTGKKI
ncbi:hypothetical protein BH23CHL2_BH23CHL2_24980 [soil metagenome]